MSRCAEGQAKTILQGGAHRPLFPSRQLTATSLRKAVMVGRLHVAPPIANGRVIEEWLRSGGGGSRTAQMTGELSAAAREKLA